MASTFTSLLNIRRRIGLAKGDPIPFILYSYRKGACHMNIEQSTDGQKIHTLVYLGNLCLMIIGFYRSMTQQHFKEFKFMFFKNFISTK